MICAAVDVTKLPRSSPGIRRERRARGRCCSGGSPSTDCTRPVSTEDLGDVLSPVLQLAAQYQLPGGFDPVVPEDEMPLAASQKPLPPLTAVTWRAPRRIPRGNHEPWR